MSLICHYVPPDRQRAELVSDTLQWDDKGPYSFGSKAKILPHSLCAMAHRGIGQFAILVEIGVGQVYQGVGLDGLVSALELIALGAQAKTEARYPDYPRLGNELHLVGYSARLKGFAAVRMQSAQAFAPEWLEPGARFSGVNFELPPQREPPSIGTWIACAEGLKNLCGAAGWIGGDLVHHELSAAGGGSVRVQKIHRFGDYAETLRAIEARWQTGSNSSSRCATSSATAAAC